MRPFVEARTNVHPNFCTTTATTEADLRTESELRQHVTAFEALKTAEPSSLREMNFPWPPPHNLAFLTSKDGEAKRRTKVRMVGLRVEFDAVTPCTQR